ncbi:MAG TPA: maleylpyruvate isomerase N-terminal domain-containing protein, partial [Acidimicrobiales bacterium]|nr:maleylpyruvate isomerase N-terminal domain-containing protein [Acidimicrobiales bacterium]
MDPDPKPWISALRSSHDRLSALVEPLLPEGVEAPSLASEWTIAQVLSHLGSQSEIFSGILDAVVAGDDLPGPEAFPPIWDAWNSRTPVEQVVDSLAANGAFQKKVEALSAE